VIADVCPHIIKTVQILWAVFVLMDIVRNRGEGDFKKGGSKVMEFWGILGERMGGGPHFWTGKRDFFLQNDIELCIWSPFWPCEAGKRTKNG
jgi:hypothetical protein